ncbi:hypothetical protein LZ31DRAFT_300170 [Colletotrichum somersetense]|nr:hypothetical protein LZ31DRAFT_300170 [Colletotrichum somersetense]
MPKAAARGHGSPWTRTPRSASRPIARSGKIGPTIRACHTYAFRLPRIRLQPGLFRISVSGLLIAAPTTRHANSRQPIARASSMHGAGPDSRLLNIAGLVGSNINLDDSTGNQKPLDNACNARVQVKGQAVMSESKRLATKHESNKVLAVTRQR